MTVPLGRLTPRQREVLALLAAGYSNQAIADTLGLRPKTVENSVSVVYRALGLEGTGPHVRVLAALRYQAAMGTPEVEVGYLVEELARALPGVGPAIRRLAIELLR